jgi:hypothetical protein
MWSHVLVFFEIFNWRRNGIPFLKFSYIVLLGEGIEREGEATNSSRCLMWYLSRKGNIIGVSIPLYVSPMFWLYKKV